MAKTNEETIETVVDEVSEKPKKKASTKFYSKYEGVNAKIDEVFAAIGVPVEYRGNIGKRKPVAEANGITKYISTVGQDAMLIELARAGKLVKP